MVDILDKKAPRVNEVRHLSCPNDQEILISSGDTIVLGEAIQRRVRLRLMSDTDTLVLEVDPATLLAMALHFANAEIVGALLVDIADQVGVEIDDLDLPATPYGHDVQDAEVPRRGYAADIKCHDGEICCDDGETIWRDETRTYLPERRMRLTVSTATKIMRVEIAAITLINALIRYVNLAHLADQLDEVIKYHDQRD